MQEARYNMVETQIISRGITDQATIDAMREVPRHAFVPEALRNKAYSDTPLTIGYGQTISQPYIVAFMTEHLQLKPEHKVLEIGTGSGYQAAVLAKIVDSVFTIEIVEPLAVRARIALKEMGYTNVDVITGDGFAGLPGKAPFDAIIVTAAPEEIPAPLINQLSENGRMIIPVGSRDYTQYLTIVEKKNGKISKKRILPVRFVPFTRAPQ